MRLDDGSAATQPPAPAAVVVDDGDPASADDARIGIRFQNDRNVMILQLAPAPGGSAGFLPSVNVVDVGGVPTDIAFVRTDGGLRLAALVPAAGNAVLIDPTTTIVTNVALPAPYQRLSLVTGGAGGAGADRRRRAAVAGGRRGRRRGLLGARPGRGPAVSQHRDRRRRRPGRRRARRPARGRGAQGAGEHRLGDQTFYVLDLVARTAAPLTISQAGTTLRVSPTGRRVWTFVAGGTALASTDVATKQVRSLRADSPIDDVFEIGRAGDETDAA